MLPPAPLQGPMGSSGPAGPQTANAGQAADSLSKVREAVNLLQMALIGMPVGSEEHKSILKMIDMGAKISPASQAVPGVQQTQLMGLQQDAQKNAMMQAVMRQMAGGQQGGPPQLPPQEAA